MSDTRIGANRLEIGLAAADWLSLAAAPAFAIMALLTAAHGPTDLLCSAAHQASPLGGMTLMYGLMSLFHAPPWLKRVGRTGVR